MAVAVFLVVDDPDRCQEVLTAWEEVGARGATILESTGLGRLKRAVQDDLPLLPSLRDLLSREREELQHRLLFTVLEDEALVDPIVRATEEVLGDLSRPHTGFLFVVPVLRVVGLGPSGEET